MGVVGLWQILSDVESLRPLSEEGGTTLAVDLSTWIYQARNASIQKKTSPHYFMIRTIFYRTLELLKYGIKLVFVLDGDAPELKLKTLQKRHDALEARSQRRTDGRSTTDRQWYRKELKEVVQLLQSLGLPVVESPGEAEKMCAYLNSTKIVDAVLTNDSDAFLYGATDIYRNYKSEEKTAVSVSMADIEENFKLDRRSLIAFALLSGCDYNERGVKGLGPDHIMALFKEMKQHCNDILDRICGWEDDEQLKKLSKMKVEMDSVERASHCSRCDHTGTVSFHRTKGCDMCKTKRECRDDSEVVCDCPWHKMKQEISPYSRELKAREKVLEIDNFTQHCKQIVDEFTSTNSEQKSITGQRIKAQKPNLTVLCQFLSQSLHMDKAKAVTTLIPLLAHMQMKKEFDWPGFQPISIEKACKRNYVECYQTVWSKLAEDRWTTDDTYTIDVEKSQFEEAYKEIVANFQQTLNLLKVKKTKDSTPCRQMCIKDMFTSPDQIRKKAGTPTRTSETPHTLSEASSLEEKPNPCKKKLDFDVAKTSPKTDNDEHEVVSCLASRKRSLSTKSKTDQKVQNLDEHEGMSDLKLESGFEDLDEKNPHINSSPSSQDIKSSRESDIHSLGSEDLFPSYGDDDDDDGISVKVIVDSDKDSSNALCDNVDDHDNEIHDEVVVEDSEHGTSNAVEAEDDDDDDNDEDDNEIQGEVKVEDSEHGSSHAFDSDFVHKDIRHHKEGIVDDSNNESSDAVYEDDEDDTDVVIIDKASNGDLSRDNDAEKKQTDVTRLKSGLMPLGLRDSNDDSSQSDEVMLISSDEFSSSLPSLNSSSSNDVVLLDSDTNMSMPGKSLPGGTKKKRKNSELVKRPAKKVKANQKGGCGTKKQLDTKQKSLRSYFGVKK